MNTYVLLFASIDTGIGTCVVYYMYSVHIHLQSLFARADNMRIPGLSYSRPGGLALCGGLQDDVRFCGHYG